MTTTQDTSYNGWNNYPTWNIGLWMGEDSTYWDECAQEAWNTTTAQYSTHSQAARKALSEQLKDEFESLALDNNGEAGPLTDLLGWALSQVNWLEIADAWLSDNVDGYQED